MISLKDRTTKIGIHIGIYVTIILILHFFVGRTISKMVDREKKRWKEGEEELRERQELVKKYPDPEKSTEELKRRVEELREKATSGKELPRVTQQLIKKSSEWDIQILSIKPLEKSDFRDKGESLSEAVSRSYIEVVLKASYKTLGEYFKALEELSKAREIFFTIESVTIERIQGEEIVEKSKEEERKVRARLVICSYTVWTI